MQFAKNREWRRMAAIYAAVGGLLLGLSAYFQIIWLGAVFCLVYTGLFFAEKYRQYQELDLLCTDINRMLHDASVTGPKELEEGGVSILRSEVHKMMMRLGSQTQQLEKEKKLQMDVLTDISHQLKTPLTAVSLIADRLKETEMEGRRRLLLARELSGLLERMEWMLDILLKTARLEAGAVRFTQEEVSLEALIAHAAKPLELSMELHGQTLETAVQRGSTVKGDFQWLSQAIGNLLKNCTQHIGDGGSISVSGKETPLFTELCIADDGPGISEEDIPHLFERFYSGSGAARSSTGIGLFLAYRIIREHNGTVKAWNSPRGGAVFLIRLYRGII